MLDLTGKRYNYCILVGYAVNDEEEISIVVNVSANLSFINEMQNILNNAKQVYRFTYITVPDNTGAECSAN